MFPKFSVNFCCNVLYKSFWGIHSLKNLVFELPLPGETTIWCPRRNRSIFHSSKNFMVDFQSCEKSHPCLNQLNCWHDRQRTPLQDGDHSGNDPRLVPAFLRQRSEVFWERFRRMPVPVGSRKSRLTWTEHLWCGTLSCWITEIIF